MISFFAILKNFKKHEFHFLLASFLMLRLIDVVFHKARRVKSWFSKTLPTM
eukprot:UN21179